MVQRFDTLSLKQFSPLGCLKYLFKTPVQSRRFEEFYLYSVGIDGTCVCLLHNFALRAF